MRKVTGYIGALIVVVALMGSILAGYALNINGQSVVVNEYENVTDVSGLYSHTDQKTYIDYNPASNYIGYFGNNVTYTNLAPGLEQHYKKFTGGTVALNNSGITINGTSAGKPTSYPYFGFVCDYFYIYYEFNGTNIFCYTNTFHQGGLSSVGIYMSGTTIALTINNTDTYTYWNVDQALVYTENNDYDYRVYEPQTIPTATLALNNINQIIGITLAPGAIFVGNSRITLDTNISSTVNYITKATDKGGDVALYNITPSGNPLAVFYPVIVQSSYGTVDYTESNRVNNYPLPRVDSSTTSTQTINISDLSGLTNYFRTRTQASDPLYGLPIMGGTDTIGSRYNSNTGVTSYLDNIVYRAPENYYINGGGSGVLGYVNYRLSDILTAGAVIPAGTTQVLIDLSSNAPVTYNAFNIQTSFDLNLPSFNTNSYVQDTHTQNNMQILNGINNKLGTKTYGIYYPATGLVDLYNANGVKLSTQSADTTYIWSTKIPSSLDLNTNKPYITVNGHEMETDNSWGYQYSYYGAGSTFYEQPASSNAYTTNIYLTYYIDTSAQKYIDITKGFSINGDGNEVLWDNQYENGYIQLLFRADNPNSTYHNDIVISNNTITIDYDSERFYVSINGSTPVDIGKWRNIVLNIDLIHGNVSVNPVRTFNSYTNVQMDNAVIEIGELVNAAPTNTIRWLGTTNSLKFNVYSTAVFMNTYNTVMVNPALNITDYFTDLNQFYRLNLYNFSIYGDNITVNGVTGDVSGNSVTFDETTFILKDFAITYADGHAYVNDSNITLDLGDIVTNDVALNGVWYFETQLLKGYTVQKQVYEWNWSDFILDNTQFCIFYIGMALIGLIVARRFCIMSVIDYAVFITSIIVALSIQVIA